MLPLYLRSSFQELFRRALTTGLVSRGTKWASGPGLMEIIIIQIHSKKSLAYIISMCFRLSVIVFKSYEKQKWYCAAYQPDQYFSFWIHCVLCSFQVLGWKSTCLLGYGVLLLLKRIWHSASKADAWCWLSQTTVSHLWTQTRERHAVGNLPSRQLH